MNGISALSILLSLGIILAVIFPDTEAREKHDGEHWLPGPPDREK